jgi:hypothetical protein
MSASHPTQRSPHRRLKRWASAVLATTLLAGISGTAEAVASTATGSSNHGSIYHDPTDAQVRQYIASNAATPYQGWSSWSMQSSSYPGLNTNGNYSYLTEAHVLQQAKALVTSGLAAHGYNYVNIDAGWWRQADWTPEYDSHGRPQVDATRFPSGMAAVIKQIHDLGLKAGIYMPVGIEKEAVDNGDYPIAGAPGCSTHDIVYPDRRTTNGWDSSYKIDFTNPCSQYWVDSIAHEFAAWGVDFLKLDGVGPGSDKAGQGPNYDNTSDVKAWATALAGSGRKIHFELSWKLSHDYIDTWKAYSNGWRVESDVECYCSTLVQWDHSIKQRFADVIPFINDAGPGGWNDLDSLDVGNGKMDGITEAERQTYTSFWALEAAPLYTGDDLTQLDTLGKKLLTNDEVIALDQAGRPAHPVDTSTPQQVWVTHNRNGSVTVGLFNLDATPATVTANWSDLQLRGNASVRDLWQHKVIGHSAKSWSVQLPAHGSALLTITPSRVG